MSLKTNAPLMGKELVSTLPKVVGFLWVLRFLPQGHVDGWSIAVALPRRGFNLVKSQSREHTKKV